MNGEMQARSWSWAERFQYALSVWNPPWMFTLHTALYQASDGRLGATLRGIPVLLLTTTGRKTGKLRTKPLMYLAEGDSYIVVASNAGEERPPQWWLNLQNHPEATIQVKRERHKVLASPASEDEYHSLWPRLVEMNPFYTEFQSRTPRRLQVVILKPIQ